MRMCDQREDLSRQSREGEGSHALQRPRFSIRNERIQRVFVALDHCGLIFGNETKTDTQANSKDPPQKIRDDVELVMCVRRQLVRLYNRTALLLILF